ncbi:phosphatidylinositol glycan anchor biosynthesis class B [Megachile rotundata]|uniref:phosphatidylinositol glycan anchor biosynthesis class B n=1 Tax=Megachile rotundata TaxID=143995 RepID=UPI000614D716|nr:PREDICTED: GPI mannosyltransferase 3 [Megachile rotundata]
MTKKAKILSYLILWRLTSVFLIQTAHVPDEYWQSLEVAHHLAFGYGYLTWEWSMKIRSYIYPFLISIMYRILALVSLDDVIILTTLPRIFQALMSAYGEYKFYEWTKNKWALYSLCLNWYWYYCATRTLINTIETSCTMIALSMFPWRDSNITTIRYFWIIGFLCMIRPTAVIIWLPLCFYHLCTSLQNKLILLSKYIVISFVCCISSILLDSYCYGTLVISPLEFFRVNVLYKIGDIYGTQHLLWYILSGLPVLLGVHYVIFLLSIWQVLKHSNTFHRQSLMLIVICWTLGIYSLLSHKEFRFLLPLLPMFTYISTSSIPSLAIKSTKTVRKVFVALLIITNVLPGIYFSMVHQRGSLDIMNVLGKQLNYTDNTTNVLFLTPCHATPLYSHLHVNVPIKILTCEPNFNSNVNYTEEADEFFSNPMHWLNNYYNSDENIKMPSHIILFDSIVPKIEQFLKNYELVSQIFYTHFPQSNYSKYIYMYKRK